MVGEWKILLSATALKSFQQKANSGRSAPIKGKLLDLASGSWVYKLAGQQNQRKQLKIHLARTKCGELAILWQIDIGVDCGVLKQLIKIWQIGTTSQISKAIDQVIALQSTYPAEIIAKCRQQPIIQAKKYIPRQFEADSPTGSQSEGGPLDIRILDQETIEMSNKFYALTEPLIRFVLANDLNAEFPLDLSRDEEEVINHFQSATLILGRSGTGKTTCLVFKLVAQYLARKKARGENPKKQVLITRSSYLADKLRVYTQRLIRTTTSNALSLEPLQGDETDLDTEAVDDGAQQTVLALTDDSFPLVCTFDQFLQLLESTVRIMDRRRNFAIQGQGTLQRRQCVDFSCFELDYWPSFDRTLTKGFPIALVFTEIMGVIKGSAKSRKTLTPLSREDYVTLSYRLAPAFVSESERSRVYQIFESYEATKLLRRGQDDVDRVIKVLKAVREDLSLEKLLRSKFDEVYIDEVQDQRIMDIEMFLSLVKDSRGFHFAGDTAQAISQESTFRFADVKALFYEYFAAVSASTNQAELAQPVMFALSKNYRSHKGILALASLVMAWLWKAFPETVDKLEPEIGQLSGPKPVLFLGCDASILVSSHVGQVELAGNRADFGAEQVILVHDETAKAYLQAKIGDAALVLTILQSKGMEFDDVVIWNFFTDCPYLAGVRSLEGLTSDEVGAFDPRKHIQMCSILKSLYVAVTRPRIQLFLIENADEELAILERVLSLKPSEPLVEVTRSHDTNFAELLGALRPGRSDDPERWEFRGDQLMRQQNYQDALFCFNRAGSSKKATIAKGRLQEKYGRTCFAEGNLEKFKGHIEAAVSFFLEAGLITEAASNLIRLERFQQAADVWAEYGHHAKAAPLYKRAGLSRKAAESFHEAGNYDEAVAALRQGGYFDEMVSYLGTNHVHISSYCYRSCSTYCKLLLKQGRIAPQYRKDAIELLGSPKEQEEYFLGYDMIEELTALYATQRRHRDLFELCVRTKRLDQALTVPFDSGTVGRHWLERLTSATTYISSLGQDASVIAAFETELLHGGHSILGAALQDLLFFKLGKDFADRAKFSWFLEQLQLSKKFGTMVQKRYARGLYIRLADSSKGVAMQGYLSLLDILGRESKSQNAQTYSQAFKAFRKQHNIEHILLSDFISKASSHGPIKIEATKISSAAATDEDVTYANKEEEAALKIQRRWRIIFPKILHYRELALLPFNHAVTHFLKLSNKNPCRLAIRVLLLHAVVEPYLELATLNTSVKEMQEELMSLIVDPDLAPSLYETIDPVLHSARNLESIVKVQSHNLSEEVLGQLVKQGDLKGLQELVIVVQSALTDAEKDLSDLKAQMGGLRSEEPPRLKYEQIRELERQREILKGIFNEELERQREILKGTANDDFKRLARFVNLQLEANSELAHAKYEKSVRQIEGNNEALKRENAELRRIVDSFKSGDHPVLRQEVADLKRSLEAANAENQVRATEEVTQLQRELSQLRKDFVSLENELVEAKKINEQWQTTGGRGVQVETNSVPDLTGSYDSAADTIREPQQVQPPKRKASSELSGQRRPTQPFSSSVPSESSETKSFQSAYTAATTSALYEGIGAKDDTSVKDADRMAHTTRVSTRSSPSPNFQRGGSQSVFEGQARGGPARGGAQARASLRAVTRMPKSMTQVRNLQAPPPPCPLSRLRDYRAARRQVIEARKQHEAAAAAAAFEDARMQPPTKEP
ncbi:hypothetical protein P7C71_g3221, partial [Lecanoromycetidae sp. Uapishka_2]